MEITSARRMHLVRITPALAKRWLESNQGNRSRDRSRESMYATSMSRGEWLDNGDAIRFSVAGKLIDGQTRLHAVVLSGVTIEATVQTGLTEAAFKTIDRGRSRSNTHDLQVLGVKNAKETAGAIGKIIFVASRFDKYKMTSPLSALEEFIRRYDIGESVTAFASASKRAICSAAVGGALHWMTRIAAENAVVDHSMFWDQVLGDTPSCRDDWSFVLRERWMAGKGRISSALTQTEYLVFGVLAWNGYCAQKKATLLRMPQANMPELTGWDYSKPLLEGDHIYRARYASRNLRFADQTVLS